MNTAQIILELARRGVAVSLTDRGTILCPATVGDEALSSIRANKPALVELLTPPASFVAAIADGDPPNFAAIEALRHRRRDNPAPVRCADCALLVPVGCLSKASSIRNPRRDLAVLKNGRAVIEGDRLEHQCSGFYSHEEAAALARCWLETLARRNGWAPETPCEPMTENESRTVARFLTVEAADETVVTRAEIMARAHLCQGLRGTLLQVANPVQSWLEELDERFEERAAILNHEARLPPREAERRALREALQWARDRGCPANLLDRWQRGHQTRESA